MQKTKKSRFAIVAVLIFSMIAMYGYMPVARAASLTLVSDTISDSDVSAQNVVHTIAFTTGQNLPTNYRIDVTFPDTVGGLATSSIGCPGDATSTLVGHVVTCTVVTQLDAGAWSLTVGTTTNPTAGGYTVQIVTEDASAVEIENGSARFYILSDITVTAHVDASLTFTVDGLASTTLDVNGVNCSVDTASTSIDFGTLDDTSSTTACQQLTIVTNASGGYSVTVAQDHNLESAGSADIDAFVDGTSSTTAVVWSSPTATLGSESTYGHLGLTSEDSSLAAGNTFGDAKYVGFDGSNTVEVMYHNGPADGTTEHIGLTQVAYTAEISAIQEAGDYTNTLTYIATAIY